LFPSRNVRIWLVMTTGSRGISFPLLAAGVFGLTGVALGALGAHALRVQLTERGMVQAWETAARYHLIHAVALLALAAWSRAEAPVGRGEGGLVRWTTVAWSVGVVLFSGSLYGLALGGPGKVLGPITPLGGIALLIGWLLVVVRAFSANRN
jgi:uncharacterized membrane protein YgdD (TMEM256/DUF423 family)